MARRWSKFLYGWAEWSVEKEWAGGTEHCVCYGWIYFLSNETELFKILVQLLRGEWGSALWNKVALNDCSNLSNFSSTYDIWFYLVFRYNTITFVYHLI